MVRKEGGDGFIRPTNLLTHGREVTLAIIGVFVYIKIAENEAVNAELGKCKSEISSLNTKNR